MEAKGAPARPNRDRHLAITPSSYHDVLQLVLRSIFECRDVLRWDPYQENHVWCVGVDPLPLNARCDGPDMSASNCDASAGDVSNDPTSDPHGSDCASERRTILYPVKRPPAFPHWEFRSDVQHRCFYDIIFYAGVWHLRKHEDATGNIVSLYMNDSGTACPPESGWFSVDDKKNDAKRLYDFHVKEFSFLWLLRLEKFRDLGLRPRPREYRAEVRRDVFDRVRGRNKAYFVCDFGEYRVLFDEHLDRYSAIYENNSGIIGVGDRGVFSLNKESPLTAVRIFTNDLHVCTAADTACRKTRSSGQPQCSPWGPRKPAIVPSLENVKRFLQTFEEEFDRHEFDIVWKNARFDPMTHEWVLNFALHVEWVLWSNQHFDFVENRRVRREFLLGTVQPILDQLLGNTVCIPVPMDASPNQPALPTTVAEVLTSKHSKIKLWLPLACCSNERAAWNNLCNFAHIPSDEEFRQFCLASPIGRPLRIFYKHSSSRTRDAVKAGAEVLCTGRCNNAPSNVEMHTVTRVPRKRKRNYWSKNQSLLSIAPRLALPAHSPNEYEETLLAITNGYEERGVTGDASVAAWKKSTDASWTNLTTPKPKPPLLKPPLLKWEDRVASKRREWDYLQHRTKTAFLRPMHPQYSTHKSLYTAGRMSPAEPSRWHGGLAQRTDWDERQGRRNTEAGAYTASTGDGGWYSHWGGRTASYMDSSSPESRGPQQAEPSMRGDFATSEPALSARAGLEMAVPSAYASEVERPCRTRPQLSKNSALISKQSDVISKATLNSSACSVVPQKLDEAPASAASDIVPVHAHILRPQDGATTEASLRVAAVPKTELEEASGRAAQKSPQAEALSAPVRQSVPPKKTISAKPPPPRVKLVIPNWPPTSLRDRSRVSEAVGRPRAVVAHEKTTQSFAEVLEAPPLRPSRKTQLIHEKTTRRPTEVLEQLPQSIAAPATPFLGETRTVSLADALERPSQTPMTTATLFPHQKATPTSLADASELSALSSGFDGSPFSIPAAACTTPATTLRPGEVRAATASLPMLGVELFQALPCSDDAATHSAPLSQVEVETPPLLWAPQVSVLMENAAMPETETIATQKTLGSMEAVQRISLEEETTFLVADAVTATYHSAPGPRRASFSDATPSPFTRVPPKSHYPLQNTELCDLPIGQNVVGSAQDPLSPRSTCREAACRSVCLSPEISLGLQSPSRIPPLSPQPPRIVVPTPPQLTVLPTPQMTAPPPIGAPAPPQMVATTSPQMAALTPPQMAAPALPNREAPLCPASLSALSLPPPIDTDASLRPPPCDEMLRRVDARSGIPLPQEAPCTNEQRVRQCLPWEVAPQRPTIMLNSGQVIPQPTRLAPPPPPPAGIRPRPPPGPPPADTLSDIRHYSQFPPASDTTGVLTSPVQQPPLPSAPSAPTASLSSHANASAAWPVDNAFLPASASMHVTAILPHTRALDQDVPTSSPLALSDMLPPEVSAAICERT